MAKEIKTIGVLTSGGDAPGMNAAIPTIIMYFGLNREIIPISFCLAVTTLKVLLPRLKAVS